MTPEFIDQRKVDLKKKKIELEEQLKTFATKEKGSPDNWQANFPKITDSEEDKVDEVEEFENMLGVEYTFEEDLKNVNKALENIEKGIYGKCDNCNREISEERLIILPEAMTCLDCNKKKKKK